MEIVFSPEDLIGTITEIEKTVLPNASYKALNRAVFLTSREILPSKAANPATGFSQTVPFTRKSFLYDKPIRTTHTIESRIYIRDDAPKGNAPADYLAPNLPGGPNTAYRTRFQRRLEAKGILGGGKDNYMMPALKGMGRSKLPKGEYTRALWGVRAMEDLRGGFDYEKKSYKTAGSYVWVPSDFAHMPDEFAEPYRTKIRTMWKKTTGRFELPKGGIYKVVGGRLKQRFISLPDTPSGYSPKFEFLSIATESVKKIFTEEVDINLQRSFRKYR